MNINNRTNSYIRPQSANPFRTSIPSRSEPRQTLILKSQNIFKQFEYQLHHMLDELYQEPPQAEIRKEEVLPFKARFPQKHHEQKLNMQQFLQKQYPPPFNGSQMYRDDNHLFDFELVGYSQQPKKQIIPSSPRKPIQLLEEIPHIETEASSDLDLFITTSNVPTKTLTEILGLDTLQKRDAFRALPVVQQKQVIKQNILKVEESIDPAFRNEVLQARLEDMTKKMAETKVNIFKIINELDLLNKGVRELKNKTRQPYALRKKVDKSPDIQSLIDEVKGTRWYTPGFLKDFQRESNVLALRNVGIDSKHNVEDELIDQVTGEVQADLNAIVQVNDLKAVQVNEQKNSDKHAVRTVIETPVMDNSAVSSYSNASVSTKKSRPIKISTKAKVCRFTIVKMMSELMDDQLF